MKKVAFIVAVASLFALAPLASRLGPVGSSMGIVGLGVLVAVAASGSIEALSVTTGAVGAFGAGMLGGTSPAAAGAALVVAAFAERTTRVRTKTARAVHVLIALVGGGLAGSLSSEFKSASLAVLVVAIVVAALLSAAPLLVEADDAVAHALDFAARGVPEPARASLLGGAELRRRAADVPLDRATAARIDKTWRSLLRLAVARVRLERARAPLPRAIMSAESAPVSGASTTTDAVLAMVDERIGEHVSALTKALTAVDATRAATVGLDDAALKNVEAIGETLEEESRALVEVKADA